MIPDGGVFVVGLAAILSFIVAFHWSGLVARARSAIDTANQAMSVISEKTIDDDEKQELVQKAALRLFGHFGLITITAAFVLLAPGVVIWLGDLAGLASYVSVTDFLLSWQVIVLSTLVIVVGIWIVRRL